MICVVFGVTLLRSCLLQTSSGIKQSFKLFKNYGLIVLFLLQHSLVQVNRKGLHEEQSSGLGTGEEHRSKIKPKGHLFGP